MNNINARYRKPLATLYFIGCFTMLMISFNNCSPNFKTQTGENNSSSLGDGDPTNPVPTPPTTPPTTPPVVPPVSNSACTASGMQQVKVGTVAELTTAISGAQPGTSIEIQPGTYRLKSAISLGKSGNATQPICLRAAQAKSVTIESESSGYMAFRVEGAYWTVENLTIKGVCASDDLCEHAFQIKENAHYTVIRNNTLVDFNAQIKGQQSNNVVIENNHLYDSRPRQTANPVTKIDVVGGKYWAVRGNLIHDYQKAQGDGISYAAFLKGYSMYGTFENNVVACSLNHNGGTRLGLSFGGGTTGAQFCWDYDPVTKKGCAYEHHSGMMRNNLVLNCSDVGIFVRDAEKSVITNNLVINTAGIDNLVDAGKAIPTSEYSRNIVQGRIKDRNGAISVQKNNLVTTDRTVIDSWLKNIDTYNYTYVNSSLTKDITPPVAEVSKDMCGQARSGNLDLGPFEFDNLTCFQNIMNLITANKK